MLFDLLLLASTATATCTHGLSMFKRAEGESVEVKTFGYGALNGPFNWASLEVENEACKAGANQSPINLDASVKVATEKPIMNIPEVEEAEFENLGTTIEVLANGTTTFAGSDFRLVQFHMHTPSEHHLNGEYHPLEIHMVHQGIADPTQLAVVALMFQLSPGESSSIIRSLSSSVPRIAIPGTKTAIAGGIDFSDVLSKIDTSTILQYTGSLTTPPCSEGVTFLVVQDALDISVVDFNAIKRVVKFNARHLQNALGDVNIIQVGNLAGTPGAIMPPGLGRPPRPVPMPVPMPNATATANATVRAGAPMAKGHAFIVTELHGQPTAIEAVVARRRARRY